MSFDVLRYDQTYSRVGFEITWSARSTPTDGHTTKAGPDCSANETGKSATPAAARHANAPYGFRECSQLTCVHRRTIDLQLLRSNMWDQTRTAGDTANTLPVALRAKCSPISKATANGIVDSCGMPCTKVKVMQACDSPIYWVSFSQCWLSWESRDSLLVS